MKKSILTIFIFTIFQVVTVKAQVINIEDIILRLNDTVNFSGFLNANFSLSQATNRVLVFHNDFQLEKRMGRHFLLGIGSYNFIGSDNNDFVNDNSLHLRYNYEFHHRYFGELYVQTQNSPLSTIIARNLIGVGTRIKIQHGIIFRSYVGVGFINENNKFLGDSVFYNYNRLNTYLSYNWDITPVLRLVQTVYYQPNVASFQNFRISTKASLVCKVSKHFSFNSTLNLETLNIQIVNDRNLRKNAYTWSNGLRYDF